LTAVRALKVRTGGRGFALPLARVERVHAPGALRRPPGASGPLVGVLQRDGRAAPVFDLGVMAGGVAADRSGRLVVVRSATGPVGLLVDAVDGVGEVADVLDLDAALPPPRPTAGAATAGPAPTRAVDPPPGSAAALTSFRIGGRLFAAPLERVQQVTALPGDRLLRLDGHPCPVVDGAVVTGEGAERPTQAIVLQGANGRFALAIEAVGPVLRPRPNEIDAAPRALGAGLTSVVRTADGALVAVLDVDRLEPGAAESEAAPAPPSSTATRAVAASEAGGAHVLVLEAGARRFAFPVEAVAEVLRAPRLVRAPGAPEGVVGVFARAGEMAPVIETEPGRRVAWAVRLRLGGEPAALAATAAPRSGRLPPGEAAEGRGGLFRPARLDDGRSAELVDPRARMGLAELARAFGPAPS
jgi:purine-binding chemotaxis protein CheW